MGAFAITEKVDVCVSRCCVAVWRGRFSTSFAITRPVGISGAFGIPWTMPFDSIGALGNSIGFVAERVGRCSAWTRRGLHQHLEQCFRHVFGHTMPIQEAHLSV